MEQLQTHQIRIWVPKRNCWFRIARLCLKIRNLSAITVPITVVRAWAQPRTRCRSSRYSCSSWMISSVRNCEITKVSKLSSRSKLTDSLKIMVLPWRKLTVFRKVRNQLIKSKLKVDSWIYLQLKNSCRPCGLRACKLWKSWTKSSSRRCTWTTYAASWG